MHNQATHVLAQAGTTTMGVYTTENNFRPALTSGDLNRIVRVLGLGASERESVEALHEGYVAALRNEGALVRDFVSSEIEKSQALNDAGLLDAARAKAKEWEARSRQLERTFIEDLTGLLSKDQESRWPTVERELRRLRSVGKGRLSGESLDVVRLVEEVHAEPTVGELADLLERYCAELDYALIARDRFVDQNKAKFHESIRNGDVKTAKDLWEESQRVRSAVSSINERFARQVESLLPEAMRVKFQARVFEISFPALARPTFAEEYLRATLGLEDLSAQQRTRVREVESRYELARRGLWTKAAEGWKQFEAEEMPRELAKALGRWPEHRTPQMYTGGWLPSSHPLQQYRQERLKLDQTLRRSLDDVLTSEQRATIPARSTFSARFESWEWWSL